mmetsp:Transcript_140472/g.365319  ORF Transcript_140472/g.365319 Transcript_140472/m.365319 type:complete len:283 (+) Transcript_140472:3427-4275(+)
MSGLVLPPCRQTAPMPATGRLRGQGHLVPPSPTTPSRPCPPRGPCLSHTSAAALVHHPIRFHHMAQIRGALSPVHRPVQEAGSLRRSPCRPASCASGPEACLLLLPHRSPQEPQPPDCPNASRPLGNLWSSHSFLRRQGPRSMDRRNGCPIPAEAPSASPCGHVELLADSLSQPGASPCCCCCCRCPLPLAAQRCRRCLDPEGSPSLIRVKSPARLQGDLALATTQSPSVPPPSLRCGPRRCAPPRAAYSGPCGRSRSQIRKTGRRRPRPGRPQETRHGRGT